MKVCVVGSGYVGLVTGTSFADLGNDVIGVDIDVKKVKSLNEGRIPIYEPGLEDIYKRNLAEGRIRFITDIKEGITKSDVIFIAVGTPQGADHRADVSSVLAVAKEVGIHINGYKVIVDKSTVPLGTAERVSEQIRKHNKSGHPFDVVSNPEFLREGNAVRDFNKPDRIVVGAESVRARKVMEDLYKGIARTEQPLVFTDVKSAELIKYASNAMLATRISFINMLSCLCEESGADIKEVARGLGLDKRIGSRFLHAGIGYGGSCFPKDVNALIKILEDHNCDASLLQSVVKVNQNQRDIVVPKVKSLVPELSGSTVAVWGIAFKPKTDDIRDAPAIDIIQQLQKEGANIRAYDPEAKENVQQILSGVTYCDTPLSAIEGADCLVICTEWNEFRSISKDKIKELMKNPVVVDGRNIYEPEDMKKEGFKYKCIGR